MSVLAFDVKYTSLIDDPNCGFTALEDDARAILDHVCHACQENGWPRPLVTEFGRTRDDMEKLYLQTFIQKLGPGHDDEARAQARDLFSWHCVNRAFDLRDWIYTDPQREALMESVRRRFPHAEVLDHAVPGGARHFHFGAPDPAGKPKDWA